MTDDEKRARWDACYAQVEAVEPEPLPFLTAHADWLPAGGRALDLACGRGGNALFLARRGRVARTGRWLAPAGAMPGCDCPATGARVICSDRGCAFFAPAAVFAAPRSLDGTC